MTDTPKRTTKKNPYCRNCRHATLKGTRGYCKLYDMMQDVCVNICQVRNTRQLKQVGK